VALTNNTRNQLRIALTSADAADKLADAIDAGSGVISVHVRRRLAAALGSIHHANRISDLVQAGQPLAAMDTRLLSSALASWTAARDIQAEMAS